MVVPPVAARVHTFYSAPRRENGLYIPPRSHVSKRLVDCLNWILIQQRQDGAVHLGMIQQERKVCLHIGHRVLRGADDVQRLPLMIDTGVDIVDIDYMVD